MIQFVLNTVENNVGNGENAGNQHFLPFAQYFKTFFPFESLQLSNGLKPFLP